MNARALHLGQFIAATDFGIQGVIDSQEPTFTISHAVRQMVADMKKPGEEIEKGIVYFSDYPRGWVMNSTNLQCLIALCGGMTEDWAGKRVTLFTMPTNTGPGIRVKGSPDLTADLKVAVKLPRKKPITIVLVPTGTRRGSDFDEFAVAVRKQLGLDPKAVAEWIRETTGKDITTATANDLRPIYARIEPGGADRAGFDASPFAGK